MSPIKGKIPSTSGSARVSCFLFNTGTIPEGPPIRRAVPCLGPTDGDPSRLLQAEWTLGQTLFHLGDFVSARQHVEHALALYDPRQHRSRAVQDLGDEPQLFSVGLMVPWLSGASSRDESQGAYSCARVISLLQCGVCPDFCRWHLSILWRWNMAEEIAEKAIALCREQEFPMWLAFGEIFRGWALVRQGREEEGINRCARGSPLGRLQGRKRHARSCLPGWLRPMGEKENLRKD